MANHVKNLFENWITKSNCYPAREGTGFADVSGRVWKNDQSIDGKDRFRMHTINFNWSNLPQPTTLVHDKVETTDILDVWNIEDGETIPPALPDPTFSNIRVRFKSNHRVEQPPNVRKAQIIVDNAPGLRRSL